MILILEFVVFVFFIPQGSWQITLHLIKKILLSTDACSKEQLYEVKTTGDHYCP